MNKRHAGLSALMSLVLLAGCSEVNQFLGNEESVNYKSAVTQRGEPLSIPPDLTQAASDPRYRAPASGSTTYSQFQQQGQAQANAPKASNVLPNRQDMRVERDGDLRWLVVDRAPEDVFPRLVDFWTENGFTVASNNPAAGLIETDWAENRAKIPESWLRQALGAVLESAWDSGEREKFRTRVERVNGHTEIYVSHRQMLEKRVGNDGSQVQWQNGKEDPGLNAAMLARMMVYLGTDVDNARKLVQQAEAAPQKPAVQQDVRTQGAALIVSESFDRAWRRVGVALDGGGFSVEDRDRSAGDYYVRYVDTDTGEKIDQPGFFSRMFSGDKKAEAPQYRIHLVGSGEQTTVTVLDAKGERDNSATAQRLLSVLKDKM
ncbi:outer membrane protein assembly factor BamC [Achromobacter xylosoxidans]|jgi:outer membrane protein assembly factor BamC|uniref:outer membrane protein assembly factor BamC n=1 Tax=Achromobacter TaxID=222 RepID=UPI0001F4398F|nr:MULTISPECIES: outer membrane protein assembly factor BamC [Achromobacter]AHC48921.1 putative transmembrane protein [Achromobacter xylosoxidans NBRC 15126 = ATCC 27061]AMH04636.1 outer membrane protein assembly factor BamC [Achromobacter xylosoxidans]AXA79110.1 outer membrane protein assembly factor BamC [Achromobacter xylosoxidans]EFV85222.1 lipoprotein [Achromobacter xylosoxidans C54]MCH1990152.1 outer membrane protein assembly factor BamC [Achromobacter xylosoxidans]